jgi:hypothetical protein
MKTFHMQLQLCPECGYELDASTKVQGEKGAPEAGDVTVCFGCAALLQWDPYMKLAIARLDDMPSEIRGTLEKLIETVKEVRKR